MGMQMYQHTLTSVLIRKIYAKFPAVFVGCFFLDLSSEAQLTRALGTSLTCKSQASNRSMPRMLGAGRGGVL